MAVYLVRHAEDRAAAELRFGDQGLTERGVEQARDLAAGFAGVSLRGCLVSPLVRAAETAEILLEGRDLAVEISPSLAEGETGELTGLSFADAARRYPRDFERGHSVVARLAASGRTAPGGESRDAFVARAAQVRKRLERELQSEGDSLLVVSHGGLLNYALQQLLGMPVRDEVPFGFDHCGVLRLVNYREPPGFGSFPMLRFAPLAGSR
ncbi:MAG: histidine phosphatase family protein [Deltaproteobacteria bacterium]|nr:histidine phosphatase family protein [Deltaproteobacteria bacterium]MBW2413097.1 histidine phosphatase family protein [Deltaproteobacteria bacterium]